ncbi:MAG: tRNA 2-thiouridine(34) synthase MnmA [Candidatus Margulisbacteria bacterium]|nr:tRNA 2-thiouridine(34) synthase MnmA [Candidatus Margulisiibacteriota bacterium]
MVNKKVLVAMSGGVDSSVVAALLKEQGYDLVGVTMNLACTSKASDRGCCSLNAAADAKKVAELLGFPHYTINMKDDFKHLVIDNFIEEYKNGRTPNPCIRCNQFIKFDLLMKKTKELGAEYVATGHYARIENIQSQTSNLKTNPNIELSTVQKEEKGRTLSLWERGGGSGLAGEGRFRLLKGKDSRKDQSYVLYRLTQEQLAHTLFPLGEMTKDEVRKLAKKYKLPVAEKPESQEICFVEDDDYGRFLKEALPDGFRPGQILDVSGKVVGEHQGIAFYTIGQRKGIGAHKGEPKYVVGIDPQKNAVIIGDDKDTLKSELVAEDVTFISGEAPAGPLDIRAKIRYNSKEAEAVVRLIGGLVVSVKFKEPQRAVTPGQSVVFYKGDEVLGGGIISR